MKNLFYKCVLSFIKLQYHMLMRDAECGYLKKDKIYTLTRWFYLRNMVKVKSKIK